VNGVHQNPALRAHTRALAAVRNAEVGELMIRYRSNRDNIKMNEGRRHIGCTIVREMVAFYSGHPAHLEVIPAMPMHRAYVAAKSALGSPAVDVDT
jgi:hypothetical protein